MELVSLTASLLEHIISCPAQPALELGVGEFSRVSTGLAAGKGLPHPTPGLEGLSLAAAEQPAAALFQPLICVFLC